MKRDDPPGSFTFEVDVATFGHVLKLSVIGDGSRCAMCDGNSAPMLDFLLPPQQGAIQFCGGCLSRIVAEATTLKLLDDCVRATLAAKVSVAPCHCGRQKPLNAWCECVPAEEKLQAVKLMAKAHQRGFAGVGPVEEEL